MQTPPNQTKQWHYAIRSPYVPLIVTVAILLLYGLFAHFLPTLYGEYADRRFILCGSMLWLIALQIGFSPALRIFFISACFWSLWVFFIVTAGSKANNPAPVSLWVEPVYYSFYIFSVLAMAALSRTSHYNFPVDATYLIAIACFIYAAMTINVYLFAVFDGFGELRKIIPWGFVNIRYWGHMASWFIWLLPLPCLIGPWHKHRLWICIVYVTAAIWWWILILSLSRGSLLSLICSFIIVLIIFRKGAYNWLKTALKQALGGVVLWFLLSVLVPSIVFEELSVRTLTTDSSGRNLLWAEALAMSVQHFPFGAGPLSWLTHTPIRPDYPARAYLAHPHNMYLMAAAQYGWIALLPLILTASLGWARISRLKHQASQQSDLNLTPTIAFLAASFSGAIHAFFSGIFTAPSSMLAGLIVLGIAWGQLQPSTQTLQKSKFTTRVVLLIFLVAGGSAWWKTVANYHTLMKVDERFYQENIKNVQAPGFWFQGDFPRSAHRMPPATNGATHNLSPAVD